jgi:hypothetical protein
MMCLAEKTIISFLIYAQLFLWPCTHTHTHTQINSAYVRKVFVININIISVVTAVSSGGKELGFV